ncbi:M28 family peptidase [Candidatus Micrarchaeota archaeon]|nr:M28 family peptidase [Candidatus Micrarchaeota archaeon]
MNTGLLQKLIDSDGISGKEMEVRNVIEKEIKKYVTDIEVDKLGNLIAHKKGRGSSVMLAAHMDEVGLVVSEIGEKENDGRISLHTIGGIEPLSLIGQKVSIENKVMGVITTQEMSHGIYVEDIPTLENLFIDTGLTKKELLKKGVNIGSYVSFAQCDYCTLGSSNIVLGKAVDNRVGCYMLLELAKLLKNSKEDIYYVFTVQEEIGLYGAKISAYQISPDWAIVIDVTDANKKTVKVGNGPYITIKDADMLGNRCINNWLKDIAKKNRINLQYSVSDVGTTDAQSIAFSKEGIPTSVVGVAVRNLHTSFGIVDMTDIKDAIKLLEILLKKPPKKCIV